MNVPSGSAISKDTNPYLWQKVPKGSPQKKPAPICVFCGTFDGANVSFILIFVYNIDPFEYFSPLVKLHAPKKTGNCMEKFQTGG